MAATLHHLIKAAFGGSQPLLATPSSRRRRKLWELSSRTHCPLIGTCLPVAEMRKLALRVGLDERAMSDYSLHTAVVSSCDTRSELAEQVQRYFDKRYAVMVQRFGKARGVAAVMRLWHEVLQAGNDIAGALWAAWSHADLDDEASQPLYGDIHMLSHQVGASARADLRQLEQLKLSNGQLRNEAAALRLGLTVLQRDKERDSAQLSNRLRDAEQRASLLGQRELELTEARRAARNHAAVVERATAMTQRIELLEDRNAANARHARQLAGELNQVQEALVAAEAALEMALGVGACDDVSGSAGCGRSCPAEAALAGRCVLCIGGKTNLINGYRRLVETQGGRFLHHDGGQEESLHRIDAVMSGADAVVCQSGCISHAAYYRLKDACKKLGKPCVFVQSPGVSSFARGLAALHGERAQVDTLAAISLLPN